MKTVCWSDSLVGVLRRSLLLTGFLLGCGLVALVSAGSAQADEQERSSQASGESTSGVGLLGGLLEPVVGAVEPVTAPLLAPVTEPLSPVLEVLAPVTKPLLGPTGPVVTPVAQGLGVQPQALGVDPARTVPVAPASDVGRSGVDVTAPAETSTPMTPLTTRPAVTVEIIGPLWTTTTTPSAATATAASDAAGPQWHGRPARGPVPPHQDLVLLAGATGTASSGGHAGGSPGQADLPGYQGVGPSGGVHVVHAERWLMRPWCYVFGRPHPS